jgi:hypothetical protein
MSRANLFSVHYATADQISGALRGSRVGDDVDQGMFMVV